ncbi:MAG: iron chaperone [Chloroflexota bacterium]
MARDATVEPYLAGQPPERRAVLESVRATIRTAAPHATETIAYDMPAFRSHGGQFLVSYAAYKRHYSLFPASAAVVDALGADLTPYLSGKGTIRFPVDAPIPLGIVSNVVRIRLAENAARAGATGSDVP